METLEGFERFPNLSSVALLSSWGGARVSALHCGTLASLSLKTEYIEIYAHTPPPPKGAPTTSGGKKHGWSRRGRKGPQGIVLEASPWDPGPYLRMGNEYNVKIPGPYPEPTRSECLEVHV